MNRTDRSWGLYSEQNLRDRRALGLKGEERRNEETGVVVSLQERSPSPAAESEPLQSSRTGGKLGDLMGLGSTGILLLGL